MSEEKNNSNRMTPDSMRLLFSLRPGDAIGAEMLREMRSDAARAILSMAGVSPVKSEIIIEVEGNM